MSYCSKLKLSNRWKKNNLRGKENDKFGVILFLNDCMGVSERQHSVDRCGPHQGLQNESSKGAE